MDFTLDETHEAVRDLAREILRSATPGADDGLDRSTWKALADAGLVGIALGEDVGGGGLDLLAQHLLLVEVGRAAAVVPAWPCLSLGATSIDRHGSESLRSRVLPGVSAGTSLVTAALTDAEPAPLTTPRVTALPDSGGWRVSGTKTVVPLLTVADALLVSVTGPDGTMVVAIDLDAEGVTVTPQSVLGDLPHGHLELDEVAVAADSVLGGDDSGAVLADLLLVARSGLASLQSGICQAAVGLAAAYTSERQQFGRPIATFQAVEQRVADAHIQAEGVRMTALEAAWRLATGRDAIEAVTIAAWWAAEGSHQVLTAAHHVHGGTGVDREYPLHRYFEATRAHEFILGGAESHLGDLAAMLQAV